MTYQNIVQQKTSPATEISGFSALLELEGWLLRCCPIHQLSASKEAALRHNKNGRLVRNNPQFSVYLDHFFLFRPKNNGQKKGSTLIMHISPSAKASRVGLPAKSSVLSSKFVAGWIISTTTSFDSKKELLLPVELLSSFPAILLHPVTLKRQFGWFGLASAEDKSTTKPNLSLYC